MSETSMDIFLRLHALEKDIKKLRSVVLGYRERIASVREMAKFNGYHGCSGTASMGMEEACDIIEGGGGDELPSFIKDLDK